VADSHSKIMTKNKLSKNNLHGYYISEGKSYKIFQTDNNSLKYVLTKKEVKKSEKNNNNL